MRETVGRWSTRGKMHIHMPLNPRGETLKDGGALMMADDFDLEIERLGECRIPSPVSVGRFTKDNENVLYRVTLPEIESYLASGKRPPAFEQAGPREKIYFDPSKLKCGIVTCGGLCPGLNDVIRSIVLSLHFHYGVKTVFGFPYGYEGLSYRYGHTPLELTPKSVEGIHEKGGTILGSSRGPRMFRRW